MCLYFDHQHDNCITHITSVFQPFKVRGRPTFKFQKISLILKKNSTFKYKMSKMGLSKSPEMRAPKLYPLYSCHGRDVNVRLVRLEVCLFLMLNLRCWCSLSFLQTWDRTTSVPYSRVNGLRLYIRCSTQISTRPRATKQGRVKCRCHVPFQRSQHREQSLRGGDTKKTSNNEQIMNIFGIAGSSQIICRYLIKRIENTKK